jgi:two-component system, sensor histidine kinase and response regulator
MTFGIKYKLALGFGICMLLMLGMVGLNYSGLRELDRIHQKCLKETSDMEAATDAKRIGADLYMVIASAVINQDLAKSDAEWSSTKAANFLKLQKVKIAADSPAEAAKITEAEDAFNDIISLYEKELHPLLQEQTALPGMLTETTVRISRRIAVIDSALGWVAHSTSLDNQTAARKFQAVLTRTASFGVTFSLLGIAAAFLISALISRRIAQPLAEITRAAREIERGNFHFDLPSRSGDETGVLAKAFSSMSGQVEKRTIELGMVNEQLHEDISRRTKAEIELTHYRQNLEALVEQRTVKLSQSETRIRTILETVLDGIITIDSHNIILSFNTAASLLFGYGADEVIGQDISMLMPEPYRSEHSGYLSHYLEQSAPPAIGHGPEVTGLRKDGSRFPMEISASVSMVAEQKVFIGVVRDLTARKAAEEEISESRELLSQIVEGNSIACFVIDEQHRVTHWNQACALLTEVPASEMVGTSNHWSPFYPSPRPVMADLVVGNSLENDFLGYYPETFKRSAMSPETVEAEGFFPDFGAAGRWLFFTAAPLKNREGKVIGAIETLQDITPRVISQQDVKRAKEEAEAANRAKSEFLANMSHEIRTPLNAIIGFSELALLTELSPQQHDYVTKTYNSGRSLLGVINDILDFSKIEAGKLDLEETEFALDEVLAQVIPVIQHKALEKGIEFLISPAPEVPQRLIGDPLRLGQVLMNLLGNSVKFTGHGEIELQLDLSEESEGSVVIRFAVHDTGIGMTPGQVATLFRPFTQADGSTSRKFGGTGLGLTICRSLVGMMGGEISVESAAGQGSTFSFTVPFGRAALSGSAPRLVPEELNGLRMLIVDDNLVSRRALERLLAGLPFQVDSVSSGQAAIEAIKARDGAAPVRLVLMDWNMPELDGIEATRRIKNDRTLDHLPHIAIMTAFGKQQEQTEALAAGADKFLLKPLTRSDLIDCIIEVFAPEELARRQATPFAFSCAYDFTGLRLLLAEDNELNQQIARELLENVGARVSVACDGREAVEMVLSGGQSFDLVLMDIQMPGMDGIEATRNIRKDRRFSALPIIALTAQAFAEERQHALLAGMNDHVTKPIDSRTMMEAICRQLPDRPHYRVAGGAATPASSLRPVTGLDTAAALKRIGGNQKLYTGILKKFREVQFDAGVRINAALAQGDTETALRTAHTVKGLSGSIGAVELQACAAKLERSLRDPAGMDPVDLLLGRLSEEMKRTCAAVDDILAEQNETATVTVSGPVDLPAVHEVMNRLERYLKECNSESAELLEENRQLLAAAFGRDALTLLGKEIKAYEFDLALARLQAMAG